MTWFCLGLAACRAAIAVVVADDSRDPPCAVLVLPEVSETGRSAAVAAFAGRARTLWVAEKVNSRFNRAIALQRIDGQRPRDKIPAHFATDVILEGFNRRLPPYAQSGLIVIELEI